MQQTRFEPLRGFVVVAPMKGCPEGNAMRYHGVRRIVTDCDRFGEKLCGERLRQHSVGELTAEMQQREPTFAVIALPQEHPDASAVRDTHAALKRNQVVEAIHTRKGDEKARKGGYRNGQEKRDCRGKEIGKWTT